MSKFVKKSIPFFVLALVLIGVSKIAYAHNPYLEYYNYRLPSTGSCITAAVPKSTRSSEADNTVTYLGKNERCDCWIVATNKQQLTSDAKFSKKGLVCMWYSYGLENWYYGNSVAMLVKTGPSTFTQVDIQGDWSPDAWTPNSIY